MRSKEAGSVPESTNVIQLKLSSLIVLAISVIVTTAACTAIIAFGVTRGTPPTGTVGFGQPSPLNAATDDTNPPWGELVKLDLDVEQPDEYVAFEPLTNRVARWIFPNHTPAQVRALLPTLGLTATQIDFACATTNVSTETGQTILHPPADLIYSLAPETRKNLYTRLAQHEANQYMRFPYCFLTNSATEFFAKSGVAPEIVKAVSQLTYERSGNFYFSDVEVVVNQIPTEAARLHFFKTLTRSSVVMARLRIRPNSDVDKLLGYWAGNNLVRQKDLKPLLESLRRRDEGGTVSLMYLLPPFARERLYTTPLPSSPGDPNMDCHWTAMNFFNQEPDSRFSDLNFTATFVRSNYYPIAQPTDYGDLVFLLDHEGNAIHSAVYIADDIVFTKNGNNYAQPWVLMRLPNLIALYSVTDVPRLASYRNKDS
jgi:hypothetical protein